VRRRGSRLRNSAWQHALRCCLGLHASVTLRWAARTGVWLAAGRKRRLRTQVCCRACFCVRAGRRRRPGALRYLRGLPPAAAPAHAFYTHTPATIILRIILLSCSLQAWDLLRACCWRADWRGRHCGSAGSTRLAPAPAWACNLLIQREHIRIYSLSDRRCLETYHDTGVNCGVRHTRQENLAQERFYDATAAFALPRRRQAGLTTGWRTWRRRSLLPPARAPHRCHYYYLRTAAFHCPLLPACLHA